MDAFDDGAERRRKEITAAQPRTDAGQDIHAAIRGAQRQPWHRLRFTPSLEALFIADRRRLRARQLRGWLIAVFCLDLAALGVDLFTLPPTLPLLLRLGVVGPAVALGFALCQHRRPVWFQDAAAAVPSFALVVVTTWISLGTGSHGAARYVYAAIIAALLGNLIPPLRVQSAGLLSAGNVAGVAIILLSRPRLAGHLPALDLLGLMAASTAVSLGICWRLERAARHAFLLRLRTRLHMQELSRANQRLIDLSNTDALTGAANRRFFDASLAAHWQAATATDAWLTVLMADVDHFKALNDAAGHGEGDRCLQAVAAALRNHVRAGRDVVARYGGEEFVAILPGADPAEALAIAERVHRAVGALLLYHPGQPDRAYLSISIGLASTLATPSQTPEALLRAADAALLEAKVKGRNRIVQVVQFGRWTGETDPLLGLTPPPPWPPPAPT
jgi:diguanylate cyclase (GGDEF)-like protein